MNSRLAVYGYKIGKGSLGNLAFGKGHYCYRSLLHLAPGKGSILHLALVYIIRGHCHYYTYQHLVSGTGFCRSNLCLKTKDPRLWKKKWAPRTIACQLYQTGWRNFVAKILQNPVK